jgi:hypothetical protein
MLFDGRYKLVLRADGPLLFDLETDPMEDTDVSDGNGNVVVTLTELLEEETGWRPPAEA